MTLHIEAGKLPESNIFEETKETDRKPVHLKIVLPDYFEVIWDPFEGNEIVGTSFTDALGDIYCDLKKGICEYEAGNYNNAAFEWKMSRDIHWGRHAVEAIQALHILSLREQ